ncbi:hypothetical protein ACGFIV_27840 [Sphaerisporangium sp. NPDC049003]
MIGSFRVPATRLSSSVEVAVLGSHHMLSGAPPPRRDMGVTGE